MYAEHISDLTTPPSAGAPEADKRCPLTVCQISKKRTRQYVYLICSASFKMSDPVPRIPAGLLSALQFPSPQASHPSPLAPRQAAPTFSPPAWLVSMGSLYPMALCPSMACTESARRTTVWA